eukprot:TRINITY_DN8713_c0_g1_i2.p3 TRINITY_DN8713_c0_g1~~TRINITY_DN8713_c0_g1_i2.p3  ORF type:complete len:105 (-),score=14.74 TRINITY_DN8713_c0_g1_i2:32-346(-)
MLHEVSRRERIDNELLRRFHDQGDLQAREQIAERCMPLVRSIARRYLGSGQDMGTWSRPACSGSRRRSSATTSPIKDGKKQSREKSCNCNKDENETAENKNKRG